ncbi:PREDICTED: uncharacterized protein LOC107347357 [Acropora digitifera]|uniref:uncharacterized protein LOC107347357 n=1 Tax=Acropora digitifera TaxID=70779 RepID=UPI00077ABF65|nr:PREDICTED: uncharacterized protein LOC107347357 [Acropora digitifera]
MLNRAKKEQEAALKLQQEEEYKLAVRNDASKQCRTRTNELCTTQTNSNDIEIVALDDSPLPQEKPQTDDEVVYDWLGCYKDLPLYFVLVGQTKNGSDLCYPKDKVAQDGEVLKLLEKDEEGMKTMISSTKVSTWEISHVNVKVWVWARHCFPMFVQDPLLLPTALS